jgi:alpha-L-rhamnosidase
MSNELLQPEMKSSFDEFDLSPAKWIWLPSQRCLSNTFVLFRKEIHLEGKPVIARGWLTADSRYQLTVNGRRVQWGPAPCDPRWPEADPCDIADLLEPGVNVIGVQVCYFGQGDGTWPMGAPGFIFRLEVDGQLVISDSSWQTYLDRAHRPGMYKRGFLRALQEEFDARLHPYGWDEPGFACGTKWVSAMELKGDARTPAIFAGGPEYMLPSDAIDNHMAKGQITVADEPIMRARKIPLMRDSFVPAKPLTDAGRVIWKRDPNDWFESRMPASFEIFRDLGVVNAISAANEGFYFTYELPEQVVGFPQFTIEAPTGTVVEIIFRESHDPVNGPLWLDTYIFHWARFICREGLNHFEPFDFESLKWLQFHIRNASRPVTLSGIGVRRRIYPWPNLPDIECAEPALQRLFDASINTLHNSAQETLVDGMGRERQQYSGDGSHQAQAVRYAFGETQLPARFLNTFSQGMTLDGFFLDCWPGYDRLARLAQRQMGTTIWGPILDHGIGFNFDCWSHYWETNDREALREPYPRLRRFADYLDRLRRDDGLLPVENVGIPSVWIDHDAYRFQRHKRCAFNLYAAAMFQHALTKIAELFGDDPSYYQRLGREIEQASVAQFWDKQRRLFVVGDDRLCDRSLATAILYDQCPGGDTAAALRSLVECPDEMGLSYPANAIWRYRALAKCGRTDVIIRELRTRWATMESVVRNNSLQEGWKTKLDGHDQFSHCALSPLIVLFESVVGLKATAPGFATYLIEPQLADLGDLLLTAHTVNGPFRFAAKAIDGGHDITVTVPAAGRGEYRVAGKNLPLIAGQSNRFHCKNREGTQYEAGIISHNRG